MAESQKDNIPSNFMRFYDFVGSFNEGLAPASRHGKMFHIFGEDREFIPAYNNRFDKVEKFKNHEAWVEKDGKRFKIGEFGERINK